jgi:hypothetical protein
MSWAKEREKNSNGAGNRKIQIDNGDQNLDNFHHLAHLGVE